MSTERRDWREILVRAQTQYEPVKTYVMFSGGNDSSGLLHRVWSAGLCDGAVHINTGIGIEETRVFVRSFCARYGIPLIEKFAKKSYEQIVLEHGFPGPGGHRYMYIQLKERSIEELIRETKTRRSDRVMLVTGVRLSESSRRMGHVDDIVRRGATVWVAPLIDYTKSDLIDYRLEHGIPENEVSALLHMSGECLCGAFAHPGELEDIRAFYPNTAAHIDDLQKRVKAAGQRCCIWGVRGPAAKASAGMLCTDCTRQPFNGKCIYCNQPVTGGYDAHQSCEKQYRYRRVRRITKKCTYCDDDVMVPFTAHPSCEQIVVANNVL